MLVAVFDFLLVIQGFVISDWQGIDRITSPPGANYTFSVLEGIQAGIDMVGISALLNYPYIFRGSYQNFFTMLD